MSVLIEIEEESANMHFLVDMIFEKQFVNVEEMVAHSPCISTCIQTRDFYESLRHVLDFRKQVIAFRWRRFFDSCYKKILSSHETYLTCIMFACMGEQKLHENIFETFISVCALVEFLSEETLQKTGVNFCDLNPDIITIFYYNQLKGAFCRRGGLQSLLKYISCHRYVAWKLNEISDSTDTPTAIEMDLVDKHHQKIRRDRVIEKETNPDEAFNNAESKDMAAKVISITIAELPRLPSYVDLITRLVALRKKDAKKIEDNGKTEAAEKFEALNVASHGCSSSSAVSNLSNDAQDQEKIEWYENIIQAIIRHNHSKSSSNANVRGIQEEANGVLEHLKDRIKSLIEVLNECDK